MYPLLNSGVTLGTFEYDDGSVTYFAEDNHGTVYDISRELHQALLRADGTGPLDLPNHDDEDIIPELERLGLIRTGRFVRYEGIFNCFVLLPIGNKVKRLKPLCNFMANKLLPFVSILLFIVGIALKLCFTSCLYQSFHFGLYFISAIVATIAHETGHMASGIGYGYNMTDAGILLLGIFPVGAYVATDGQENERKLLFYLAGILQNLLLCGVCYICSMLSNSFKTVFEMGAFANLLLAAMNLLLPVPDLDGETAISIALGIKSISSTAKRVMQNKKYRKELCQAGIHGHILMGILMINQIAKITLIMCLAAYIIAILFICF